MLINTKHFKVENRYLQIQGIVERSVLLKLTEGKKYTKHNTFWVFVDYAPETYGINSRFDIVLEGEDNKMLPHFYNIKLLTVLDQFGNHLESIQEGWKTICRLEFVDIVPKAFLSLPTLKAWKYNKNSLKIANHKDIVVDSNSISKNVYAQVFNDLFFFAFHTNSINKKDFISSCLKIYKENEEEMNEKIPSGLFDEVEKKMHNIDC